MKLVPFIPLLYILMSCVAGPGAENVRQLQATLYKTEATLDVIDTSQIRGQEERLDSLLHKFHSDSYTDTLDLDFAQVVDSALTEIRNLRAVANLLPPLRDALRTDSEQATSLAESIREGRGTKSEQQKMYAKLQGNVSRLANFVSLVSEKTDLNRRKLEEHIRIMQIPVIE